MTEKLREADQIIVVVFEVAPRECVTEGMGMQFDPRQRRILRTQGANALVRDRPALPDEQSLRLNRRSGFDVHLKDATDRHGQRTRSLLSALAMSKDDAPRAVSHLQIIQFKLD